MTASLTFFKYVLQVTTTSHVSKKWNTLNRSDAHDHISKQPFEEPTTFFCMRIGHVEGQTEMVQRQHAQLLLSRNIRTWNLAIA